MTTHEGDGVDAVSRSKIKENEYLWRFLQFLRFIRENEAYDWFSSDTSTALGRV